MSSYIDDVIESSTNLYESLFVDEACVARVVITLGKREITLREIEITLGMREVTLGEIEITLVEGEQNK